MKVSLLALVLAGVAFALPTEEELEPYKVIWEREVFKPVGSAAPPEAQPQEEVETEAAVDRAEIEGRRLTGVVQLGERVGAFLRAPDGGEKLYFVGEELEGLPGAKVVGVGFGTGREASWVIVDYRGEKTRLTIEEPEGEAASQSPPPGSRPARPR